MTIESEAETLAEAERMFAEARAQGSNHATLDAAIEGFRRAAELFEALRRPLAVAVALTNLGAQLVNRAWIPPDLVNLQDADAAEEVLSRALRLLSSAGDARKPALEANALAWRARSRTFLAERDKRRNDLAIADAQEAIRLLTNPSDGSSNPHDLAIAHLHLARAQFFRAAAKKSFWRLLNGKAANLDEVRRHAAEALRLDPKDDHIRVQAGWLLQQVGTE